MRFSGLREERKATCKSNKMIAVTEIDPMIAKGRAFLGFFASPAISQACLNPLKEKRIPPEERA